jgi:hypothetical protein
VPDKLAFHPLSALESLGQSPEFQNARAIGLLAAIGRNKAFTLIDGLRDSATDGGTPDEYLVVDVECHEIPGRNPAGIRVPERLALRVPADRDKLVEAIPMRVDFPALIHLNSRHIIPPYSLCLYFDKPIGIARTWTPETFLNRICWWLVQSAKGTLHPADQPVEQLFFNSGYELVLPWNLDELKRTASSLTITRAPVRANGGMTFVLFHAAPDEQVPNGQTDFIEIETPPIVHGFIEQNRDRFGELCDLFSKHGVGLKDLLEAEIKGRVSDVGVPPSQATFTVILLKIPIRRDATAASEKTSHRAYLYGAGGWTELGVQIGALIRLNQLFYRNTPVAGLAAVSDEWRGVAVAPMDVQRANDREASRRQSGVAEEGPTGILIGAGSLGSAMLDFWVRAGWGTWSVVDNDYIKPHNLVRHIAGMRDLGLEKAKVAQNQAFSVTMGASQVTPIVSDALDFSNDELISKLSEASLVIDASTTLEYPRAASQIDTFGRHISAFLTPNGNDGVLLAEDAQRATRLSAIEPQYYRAVILEDWGRDHLEGNLGTFWSGASCRDISFVLPYTRVVGHAANFAEQIGLIADQQEAKIMVWKRDAQIGAVTHVAVPVQPSTTYQPGNLKIVMDAGVIDEMKRLRAEMLPNETGGVIIGYFDFNVNALCIVAALPPPPDSQHSPTSFVRGIQGLEDRLNDIARRTANIVGYVGEWHSHPDGHSAAPSGADVMQLTALAAKMSEDGLSAVQIIVAENDVRVLHGAIFT